MYFSFQLSKIPASAQAKTCPFYQAVIKYLWWFLWCEPPFASYYLKVISPRTAHRASPHQAPRAQDWCQAVCKDPQRPRWFALNGLMAWHGLEPCPAHPDQGSTLESQSCERKNSALRVAESYLVPLSQSLCAHIWETATSRKNPLPLRGQPESLCPLGSAGEFQLG